MPVSETVFQRIETAYHAANVEIRSVGPFIFRNALDASLFDIEFSRDTLDPRIPRIAVRETFAVDYSIVDLIGRGLAQLGQLL